MKNNVGFCSKIAPLALATSIIFGCGSDECKINCGSVTPIGEFKMLELAPLKDNPKLLRFQWSSSVVNNINRSTEKGVTYTVCLRDNIAKNECKEIGKTEGELSLEHTIPDILDSINSDFFVIASNGVENVKSNKIKLSHEDAEAIIGYFKQEKPEKDALFGASISLSKNGDFMAVGSPAQLNRNDTEDWRDDPSGILTIFQKIDEKWKEHSVIKPDSTSVLGYFGNSASLSDDGKTLAIGEPITFNAIIEILLDNYMNLINRKDFDVKNLANLIDKILGKNPEIFLQKFNFFDDLINSILDKIIGNRPTPLKETSDYGFLNDLFNDFLDRITGNGPTPLSQIENYKLLKDIENKVIDEVVINNPNTIANQKSEAIRYILNKIRKTLIRAKEINSEISRFSKSINGEGYSPKGKVHIYKLINDKWEKTAELRSPLTENDENKDGFGAKIKLDAKGKTIAITSPMQKFNDPNEEPDQVNRFGFGFVFEDALGDGRSWENKLTVKNQDISKYSYITGISMDLSGDGNKLAISSFSDIDGINTGIFKKGVSGWNKTADINYDNYKNEKEKDIPLAGLTSIALNHKGDTIAMGNIGIGNKTTLENGEENISQLTGGVNILKENKGKWEETGLVLEKYPKAVSLLGFSVAIDSEGEKIFSGAPLTSGYTGSGINPEIEELKEETTDDDEYLDDVTILTGAAHSFKLGSDGKWSHYGEIRHPIEIPQTILGMPVAISDDGETLAAGAILEINGKANGISTPDQEQTPSLKGEKHPCEDNPELTCTTYPDLIEMSGAVIML